MSYKQTQDYSREILHSNDEILRVLKTISAQLAPKTPAQIFEEITRSMSTSQLEELTLERVESASLGEVFNAVREAKGEEPVAITGGFALKGRA